MWKSKKKYLEFEISNVKKEPYVFFNDFGNFNDSEKNNNVKIILGKNNKVKTSILNVTTNFLDKNDLMTKTSFNVNEDGDEDSIYPNLLERMEKVFDKKLLSKNNLDKKHEKNIKKIFKRATIEKQFTFRSFWAKLFKKYWLLILFFLAQSFLLPLMINFVIQQFDNSNSWQVGILIFLIVSFSASIFFVLWIYLLYNRKKIVYLKKIKNVLKKNELLSKKNENYLTNKRELFFIINISYKSFKENPIVVHDLLENLISFTNFTSNDYGINFFVNIETINDIKASNILQSLKSISNRKINPNKKIVSKETETKISVERFEFSSKFLADYLIYEIQKLNQIQETKFLNLIRYEKSEESFKKIVNNFSDKIKDEENKYLKKIVKKIWLEKDTFSDFEKIQDFLFNYQKEIEKLSIIHTQIYKPSFFIVIFLKTFFYSIYYEYVYQDNFIRSDKKTNWIENFYDFENEIEKTNTKEQEDKIEFIGKEIIPLIRENNIYSNKRNVFYSLFSSNEFKESLLFTNWIDWLFKKELENNKKIRRSELLAFQQLKRFPFQKFLNPSIYPYLIELNDKKFQEIFTILFTPLKFPSEKNRPSEIVEKIIEDNEIFNLPNNDKEFILKIISDTRFYDAFLFKNFFTTTSLFNVNLVSNKEKNKEYKDLIEEWETEWKEIKKYQFHIQNFIDVGEYCSKLNFTFTDVREWEYYCSKRDLIKENKKNLHFDNFCSKLYCSKLKNNNKLNLTFLKVFLLILDNRLDQLIEIYENIQKQEKKKKKDQEKILA